MTTISEMYAEECKQHAMTKRELRNVTAELAALTAAAQRRCGGSGDRIV